MPSAWPTRAQCPALRVRRGEGIAAAWERRRTTLAAHRTTLAYTGDPDPGTVLPDLLHLHHVQMAGISHNSEGVLTADRDVGGLNRSVRH